VIDFLKGRSDRQDDAKKRIDEVLNQYDVVAVDTLIGDIVPPADLMKTLTDRKIAEQEKLTFETQQKAQEQRKNLEAATASANMQAEVVKAERNVEISEKVADSKIKTATGDAKSKTINAEADATVTTVNAKAEAEATKVKGNATAEITQSIGDAEASVLEKKTRALGEVAYAQIQVADSLAKHNIKLVPEILITGERGSTNGMLDALLATEYFKNVKNDTVTKTDKNKR
jgi:regulator of protease activity HflC (stomatin/prohibitin superfamily)